MTEIREERFELMALLEQLPSDLNFYTQITMEAAEDPEFLRAMKRARIRGALVGVESVTPEGLKAVFKDFNCAGESLVTRLQAFREHGVYVLGSFIFGLPTDKPETFEATADLAQRAGVVFAQFVMLTPFPGTIDFAKWEREAQVGDVDGVPLNRYWLIPPGKRPKIYAPHPLMSPDEIRRRTQATWDRFYGFSMIWHRCPVRPFVEGPPGVRAPLEALSSDVRQYRHRHRQRSRRPVGPLGPLDGADVPLVLRRGTDARPRNAARQSRRAGLGDLHRHPHGLSRCP